MVKKILKAAYLLSLSAACLASPWSEEDQANLARLFSIAEENAAAIIAANREVSEERKRKTISGRLAEASSFGGGAVYGTAERLDDVLQTGTSERLNYSLGYRIDLFKLASPKIRLPETEAMRLQLMQDLKADIVTVYAEILTLR
ncbi:hypothetical protein, partial [Pelagicoccus sp. SDUM812002]|uniref:hypothetical protein n=1 Tax=Pelagicoccus sp. SDUM812002 TaxID=3041266 RepID=UPI00280D3589